MRYLEGESKTKKNTLVLDAVEKIKFCQMVGIYDYNILQSQPDWWYQNLWNWHIALKEYKEQHKDEL